MIFFFNDTATTEIYTLSLHDALPISGDKLILGERGGNTRRLIDGFFAEAGLKPTAAMELSRQAAIKDRKSTRLNSSHANISYAVFCLKKKNPLLLYFTYISHCSSSAS